MGMRVGSSLSETVDGIKHRQNERKCMAVLWNLTSLRGSERNLCKTHEDRIAGKRFTSMTHFCLVRKFTTMPQEMKIPDAEAAVDEEWKKFETIPARDLESQGQKGGYSGSTKRQKESPLCNIAGLMPPQECGVRTEATEVQRQSRALW